MENRKLNSEWFCEVSEYLVCWSESRAGISDKISGIDWGLSLHAQCYRRNILTARDFYSTIDSRCMSLSLTVGDRKYLTVRGNWINAG